MEIEYNRGSENMIRDTDQSMICMYLYVFVTIPTRSRSDS